MMAVISAFSFTQNSGGGFHQEGIASWYGGEFDGKPTASGEIFNSGSFTAAHPVLPFGTVLMVTNKQNNKRVTVRVNDRGPFVAARIIDLSRAAAEALDMLTIGTAPVILEEAPTSATGPAGEAPPPSAVAVEIPVTPPIPAPVAETPVPVPVYTPPPAEVPAVITETPPAIVQEPQPVIAQIPQTVPQEPQPVAQAPAPVVQAPVPVVPAPVPVVSAPPPVYNLPPAVIRGATPPATSSKLYRLQVGAYAVPKNAVDAFDKLKNMGLNPAYEKIGDLYRVVLPRIRAGEIQSIAQMLGNAGFREALIREEN